MLGATVQISCEIVQGVELRIGDLGGEIPRFLVQLRIPKRRRPRGTGARGKLELRKGKNPDYG